MNVRRALARCLARLAARLDPPVAARGWRNWHVVRRADRDVARSGGGYSYALDPLMNLMLAHAPVIDRFAVADDDLASMCIKTLGQRFSAAEIATLADYRIVGTRWQFEDETGVYASLP